MKLTTLILFTLLCLIGCNNEDVKERPVIIAKFISAPEGYCKYYYEGMGKREQSFEDSCNKYSIGDTIQ